jgi:hypothetical protein
MSEQSRQNIISTSGYNVEKVSARMFLLIGAVFLISSCTGYEGSSSPDYRSQDEGLYLRTGQPSMLPYWRPQYDGAD